VINISFLRIRCSARRFLLPLLRRRNRLRFWCPLRGWRCIWGRWSARIGRLLLALLHLEFKLLLLHLHLQFKLLHLELQLKLLQLTLLLKLQLLQLLLLLKLLAMLFALHLKLLTLQLFLPCHLLGPRLGVELALLLLLLRRDSKPLLFQFDSALLQRVSLNIVWHVVERRLVQRTLNGLAIAVRIRLGRQLRLTLDPTQLLWRVSQEDVPERRGTLPQIRAQLVVQIELSEHVLLANAVDRVENLALEVRSISAAIGPMRSRTYWSRISFTLDMMARSITP